MKTYSINIIVIMTVICINLSSSAYAGRQCTDFVPDVDDFYQASKMALALEKKLTTQDPQLVLVGRVGSDLSAYGIKYSHVGFLFKQSSPAGERWTFVHELNECGSRYSSLYEQGMVNFFLDDLLNMDIVVILPKVSLQKKLLTLLKHAQANQYYHKDYNMIAYPFSLQYQNSNQWVLEIIAAAQNPFWVNNRQDAQAFLKQQGFQPQEIHLSPLKKLGAGLFSGHIHFDDHTKTENQTNTFKTVSVKSIINYLLAQDKVKQIFEMSEQGQLKQHSI